jgi:hypothetical protein
MFDCKNILDNDNPVVVFHHGMKILGPIFHKEGTKVMRKLLSKKGYSTVLYYRRSSEVRSDCDDFHECISNESWKHRKLILVGHSSGACYIRYLRTHARGLHFLKSIALDGSFLYETIEYFLHIPTSKIHFKSDAPYYKSKSLEGKLLKMKETSTEMDNEECVDWYRNMYLTREPINHHIWVWYGEKPELEEAVFHVKSEQKKSEKHIYIDAKKYSHSLHKQEKVARIIIKLMLID